MNWQVLAMLLAALCAFGLSLFLVPLARIIAYRLNILDVPDGKIKQHAVSTPYLGGIAVYFCSLIPSLFIVPWNMATGMFLLGSTTLVIVGLIDDILVIQPSQKFFGQFIAVLLFLCGGFYLHIFTFSYVGIILSAFWMLTIINAFNLIDVMDGLATTVSLACSCGFMLISMYLGQMVIASIFACFAGSLLGFLVFNWPPASIYLGDTGSLFIGGLLGALPMSLNVGRYCHLGYLAPLIVLAIPLLELTSLVIIRTYKKIPFYKGSPDHFSIYLRKNGWAKKSILFYVIIMMIILIATAYSLVAGMLNISQVIFLAILFFFIWFIFLIQDSFWRCKKCE